MPSREKIQWAQLRVGVLVLVSLVAFAVAVISISGRVGLFSKRYELRTYMPSVAGLNVGAPVKVGGISIGNVKSLDLSPYPEPERAVQLTLSISAEFQGEIRSDSVASLERQGLLGERSVDISRGGPQGVILRDGEELTGDEGSDVKQIMRNTNNVLSNLRDLSATISGLTQQIEKGQGSLGKLLKDPEFYNHLKRMANSAETAIARLEKGEGTIGRLIADEALYEKMVSNVDRLDRILAKVEDGDGTLAKLINDPSVYDNLEKLTFQTNAFMARINQGEGTVGKLMTDPSLYNRMDRSFEAMNTVMARIEHGEGTLGSLSTDDSLFQNLNSATEEMRAFAQDFRKDPKKYLRIKFGIF